MTHNQVGQNDAYKRFIIEGVVEGNRDLIQQRYELVEKRNKTKKEITSINKTIVERSSQISSNLFDGAILQMVTLNSGTKNSHIIFIDMIRKYYYQIGVNDWSGDRIEYLMTKLNEGHIIITDIFNTFNDKIQKYSNAIECFNELRLSGFQHNHRYPNRSAFCVDLVTNLPYILTVRRSYTSNEPQRLDILKDSLSIDLETMTAKLNSSSSCCHPFSSQHQKFCDEIVTYVDINLGSGDYMSLVKKDDSKMLAFLYRRWMEDNMPVANQIFKVSVQYSPVACPCCQTQTNTLYIILTTVSGLIRKSEYMCEECAKKKVDVTKSKEVKREDITL